MPNLICADTEITKEIWKYSTSLPHFYVPGCWFVPIPSQVFYKELCSRMDQSVELLLLKYSF